MRKWKIKWWRTLTMRKQEMRMQMKMKMSRTTKKMNFRNQAINQQKDEELAGAAEAAGNKMASTLTMHFILFSKSLCSYVHWMIIGSNYLYAEPDLLVVRKCR